jgi:hypothetical protein
MDDKSLKVLRTDLVNQRNGARSKVIAIMNLHFQVWHDARILGGKGLQRMLFEIE